MNFKVRWGSIESFFKQKMEPGMAKAYFEKKKSIICIVKKEGQYFYSEISKSTINSDSFKMEYLSDSYELLENPLDKKKTLVTKQELI